MFMSRSTVRFYDFMADFTILFRFYDSSSYDPTIFYPTIGVPIRFRFTILITLLNSNLFPNLGSSQFRFMFYK